MPRFAQLLIDTNSFASGAAHYADQYPGDERNARLVLAVTIANRATVQAVVDTGTPWCILDPEIVERLEDAVLFTENLRDLMIRGERYDGRLGRVEITLQADCCGVSIAVEATVFVPTLRLGEVWCHPNFIGLQGFLARIRYAVDPEENVFYFGPV